MITILDKVRTLLNLSYILFFSILVIPVVLIALYQYLFASNRFESVASVYITEERSDGNPFDLSLLGIQGTSSNRDILVLKSFIMSPTLMHRLDKKLGILEHFSSLDADFFSRLSNDAEREYALQHFNERVVAELDEEAQLLNLSVQTFDPDYSKRVLEMILEESQRFIDKLNANISNAQLVFFESAVKQSEDDLLAVNRRLQEFQQKNRFFSTEITTRSITSTIAGLEQQLAIKQAELISRQGALGRNAPTLVRLRAEIEALQKLIVNENERLAGGSSKSLSELDSEFREISLRIEYKTLRYKANLEAFEKAQLDTARRLRFLTVVSAPTLPEASLYPNRAYIVITSTIVALMIYFVVSISLAIMREHG